jgi:hypothetical protein
MSKLTMTLGTLALLLSSRSAEAFVMKVAANGQPVHWAQPTVTFVVDPSIEQAVPGGAAAVSTALSAWSSVSGGPEIVVTAGPGGGKVAVDGQNTVLFAPDGYPPAGAALAITVVNYDEQSGEIIDTDIVVNGGAHQFAVLSEGAFDPGAIPVLCEGATATIERSFAVFDLVHVLSHETGHALGLGDVAQSGEVMYAYSTPGDASYRAPASDDLAGVEALYMAQQPKGGCGGGSASGGATASTSVAWWKIQNPGWAAAAILPMAGLWWGRRRRPRGARKGS